jgi:NADH-quinone oxidoreductase subunit H
MAGLIAGFLALMPTIGAIIALMLALVVVVIYLTYLERKVINYMQSRIGPQRIGPYGLLQPFADMIKLLHKELIFPSSADRYLFVIAPIISFTTALAGWAIVPWQQGVVLANLNAG